MKPCHAVILTVLLFFAWGNNALHAQNANPADTAAGAGVKATPSVAPAAEAPAQATGTSLPSNGDIAGADAGAANEKKIAAEAVEKRNADLAVVQQILASPSITPEIKVSGNKLVTASGTTVWLQGVNVPSLEWSAKGENVLESIKVAIDEWKANVIRLPLNYGFWFGRGKVSDISNSQPVNDQAAAAYRQLVDNAVKMAAARGAYIILDLHRYVAPDAFAVEFWKDVAARYKDNPAVLFDMFNEPHNTTWEVWRNGGDVEIKHPGAASTTYKSPGMQGLVDAIRGTGAKNIIVAGGLGFAFDLTGILTGYALEDKTGNGIMYATHFYNWHKGWQKHFLGLVDKYPLLVGETGADIKKMPFVPAKNQEDPYTFIPDAIGLIQKYHLNWTAWCFHTHATPRLLSDWTYDPTPFYGVFVKEALAGKQFEMQRMR